MDPTLAALKIAIEAAAPGTPSLTCLKIAEALIPLFSEAKAEAWARGEGAGQYNASVDYWGDDDYVPNPYRD